MKRRAELRRCQSRDNANDKKSHDGGGHVGGATSIKASMNSLRMASSSSSLRGMRSSSPQSSPSTSENESDSRSSSFDVAAPMLCATCFACTFARRLACYFWQQCVGQGLLSAAHRLVRSEWLWRWRETLYFVKHELCGHVALNKHAGAACVCWLLVVLHASFVLVSRTHVAEVVVESSSSGCIHVSLHRLIHCRCPAASLLETAKCKNDDSIHPDDDALS